VQGAKVHVGLKELSGMRFLNDEEVEVR